MLPKTPDMHIIRVFSGDASTLPALLDPALQSLVSGSPLSQAALAIGYEQFSSSSSSREYLNNSKVEISSLVQRMKAREWGFHMRPV